MPRPLDPAKRLAVLNAAQILFLEKGYTETRISDIATQSGFSIGTIYRYFDSKEAITKAIAEAFYARIQSLVGQTITSTLTDPVPPANLQNIIRSTFALALENPEILRSPITATSSTSPPKTSNPTPDEPLGGAPSEPSQTISTQFSETITPNDPPPQSTPRHTFLSQLGASLATLIAIGKLRDHTSPHILSQLIVVLSQPVIQAYLNLPPADRDLYETTFLTFVENTLTHTIIETLSEQFDDRTANVTINEKTASRSSESIDSLTTSDFTSPSPTSALAY
jgi:AcrR family transcriptional regulator